MKKAAKVALAILGAALVLGMAACSNASGGGTNTTVTTTTTTDETQTTPSAPTTQPESGGSGGGSQQQTPATYTVTFDTDGGSAVKSQTVTAGQKAARPATEPTKNGDKTSYVFLGWYKSDLSAPFDFDSAINEPTTIKAKWLEGFVKVEGATIEITAALTPESLVFITGRTFVIPMMYVCDHEVTQEEYETYCKYGEAAPSAEYGVGTNYPTYYVSWYDAVVYCNLRTIAELGENECVYSLSGKTHPKDWPGIVGNKTDKYCGPSFITSTWDYKGDDDADGGILFNPQKKGYRLPTEAEWEYIGRNRNADNYTYAGGNNIGEVAWYKENSGDNETSINCKIHEVKTKKRNGLGVFDMSGNVREWCHDWWSSITISTPMHGASSGGRHVIHGGGWYDPQNSCTFFSRPYGDPDVRVNEVGFRVVRTAN